MLFNTFLPVLVAAPLALAAQATPRKSGHSSNPLQALQARQSASECAAEGYTTCDDGCMPLTGVCCDDGSATFCDIGEVCTSDGGCCPIGEICSGGGGTQTIDIPGPTGISGGGSNTNTLDFTEPTSTPSRTQTRDLSGPTVTSFGSAPTSSASSGCLGTNVVCGNGCMPAGADCCTDGYCDAGTTCVGDGTCSRTGKKPNAASPAWAMDSMAVALAGLVTMGFFVVR